MKPFDDTRLNKETVKEAIEALSDTCPVERSIKSNLKDMWLNASKKQIAFIKTLYTI